MNRPPVGWQPAPEVEWDRRQRATQYTPDTDWGRADLGIRRDRRRPRTRVGRAVRWLWTRWWIHTTYTGAILGVAVYGIFAVPVANADDGGIVFTAPAIQYAAAHAEEVCADLDGATVQQVDDLMHKLVTLGHLTPRVAAEAAYFTALTYCPANLAALDAYANQDQVMAL